jgi:hypothetical protein
MQNILVTKQQCLSAETVIFCAVNDVTCNLPNNDEQHIKHQNI